MREGISGTWLFQIVIVFVLLFSGYLALSMNYSRAFKVKNEVLHIIERHKGITDESIIEIQNYMKKVGYRSFGKCDNEGNWVGINRDTVDNDINGEYYICVENIDTTTQGSFTGENPPTSYFRIKSFFHLDIPLISILVNLKLTGETKELEYPGWPGI